MVKNLSVFFPCFNEEGNIEGVVKRAIQVLQKLNLNYEITIVDDGSFDRTKDVLEKLIKIGVQVKVIHHQKNLGYGEALKSGFYNANYDTIVYTDCDGQFDFSEVKKFLEKIEDNDLVIGYRIKRRDPFFRILFKKGWKLALLTFFGLTLRDVDCGFKMIKKAVLKKIPHLQSSRGAMINAELAIKAKKYGFKIGQVGVTHFPRVAGKPTGANLQVIIKSFLDLFRLWWKLKDEKHLFILLMAGLFLATFLRFYRLSEYMTFLGDEGRDAIVIKRMLTEGHFPAIGPPTSVGNIYLGPLYYYMMAIPMAIFWLNPLSAAGMNALIGVLTVALIYYLGKVWFGRGAGLIASYLYAISPVNIIHSRSSWNPNPAPFFALIGIFGLYRMHKSGNFLWLILVGLAFAAALQMHYLALILIPIGGILWIHEILYRWYKKQHMRNVISGTILGILAFLLLMSPLFIFDLKHDFLNYKAVSSLFTKSGTVDTNIFNSILRVPNIFFNNLIGRYLTGEVFYLTVLISLLVLLPIILAIIKKQLKWPYLALSIWLLVGLLGISFYNQSIFDHYLGFFNPVPFLFLGSLTLIRIPTFDVGRWFLMGVFSVLIITLTIVNLQKNPLNYPPNNQLKRTQDVAKFIIAQSENRPFNFALLSENNYDSAYQFYLDIYGFKPRQVPFEITDQLFVICEDPVCDPIYSPKYEIAAFGWTLIDKMWEVKGLKIYKLVQNPEQFK